MRASDRGIAVVGGGAGALGRAVVARLLAGGFHVVAAVHRDPEPEIPGATAAVCDLSDPAAVEALASTVRAEGRWAAVVNTSGGYAGDLAHEVGEDELTARLEANLLGPWRLAAAGARAMVAQGSGGRIVNVAGRAAVEVATKQAVYQVAKTALLRLTQVMAAELREHGITVNAVLPSIMDTPLNRRAIPGDPSRWVPTDHVAAVIAWLLSDEAADVSGAAVPVYGRS